MGQFPPGRPRVGTSSADHEESSPARVLSRDPVSDPYHLAFDKCPRPMWVFDCKTLSLLAVNEAAVRQLGYSRDELLGMTLLDIRPREGVAGHVSAPTAPSQPGLEKLGGTWRHRRKDGSTFLAEIAASEVEFEGRPAALVVAEDVTDREAATTALRDSESRKSAILEYVRECVIAADSEGHITEFNAAAEQMFGYSRSDAIGRDLAEIVIPPHLRARHRRGWAHYVETGEAHILGRIVELPAMRHDGSEFPAEVLVSSIRVDRQRAFAASVRDLTDRKRFEAHLALQYAISRVLAESQDLHQATREIVRAVCETVEWDVGAIWQVDVDAQALRLIDMWHIPGVQVTTFEELSRKIPLRCGLGLPGRVWGRGEPAWISDVVDDGNFPRAGVAAECGLHGAFAFPIKVDDEVVGVVEFFSHEVRRPEEDLLQLFASIGNQIGQYIQRKRGEQALHETNEMLRTLLRSSPLAIVHLGTDLLVRFWNPAAERMLGWSEKEMLGKPYPDILPADKRDEFRRLRDAVMRGSEIIGFETTRRRRDGSDVHVLLSIAPLRAASGEVTGMLGVVADLDVKKLV